MRLCHNCHNNVVTDTCHSAHSSHAAVIDISLLLWRGKPVELLINLVHCALVYEIACMSRNKHICIYFAQDCERTEDCLMKNFWMTGQKFLAGCQFEPHFAF